MNDLRILKNLQDVDSRIDRVAEEMAEIPREKRIHERELESQKKTYEDQKKKIDSIRESSISSSKDKEATENRLAEFKTKLLEMKTNEAYRAMMEQIKFAEKKIGDIDIRILEFMYEEEAAEEEHKEAGKAWERNRERSQKRHKILDGQLEVLKEDMDRLQEERTKVAAGINRRLLDKYEQLRSTGKGLVVVGLYRGSCGGCLTNVPPQTAVEISQGKTFTCPICGRFVIWTDDSSFAGS